MSAFLLNDDTIDLLTAVAVSGTALNGGLRVYHLGEVHVFTRENADQLGQILIDANYASVNYRYRESEVAPTYTYRPVDLAYLGGDALPFGQVFASTACYDYQSCEDPSYSGSMAKAIIDAINRKVQDRIARLVEGEWVWSREGMYERLANKRLGVTA